MTRLDVPCHEASSGVEVAKAGGLYDALRRTPPRARGDLRNYVKVFLGIEVPDRRICDGHSSPMDYLWHSHSIDNGLWMMDD